MRILTYTVTPEEDGRMVKGILRGSLQLSYTLLKSLKWRENAILLNGQSVHVNTIVHAGDTVSVVLSERTPREDLYCANAAKPDIVYEDDDLLVLNKPAGIAMHPKSGDASASSLAAMLTSYLGEGSVPHFVSRLDKGTSGLLIAAKNGYVHDRLRRALHSSDLRREYRAVAVGRVEPPCGVIDAPIGPRGGLHHPPLRARGRTSEPHGVRDSASKRPLHAPVPAPTDGSHASASRPHGIPRSSPRGRLALRHGGQNPHRPPRAALVRAVVHPAGHRTGIHFTAPTRRIAALDGNGKSTVLAVLFHTVW